MTKFVRLNKEGMEQIYVDALKVSVIWSIDDEHTVIRVDGQEITIDMPIESVLRAFSILH